MTNLRIYIKKDGTQELQFRIDKFQGMGFDILGPCWSEWQPIPIVKEEDA